MTASRDRRAGSDHDAARTSSDVTGVTVVLVVLVVERIVVAVDACVALLLHAAATTTTRAGKSLRGTAVDPSDREGHVGSSGEVPGEDATRRRRHGRWR